MDKQTVSQADREKDWQTERGMAGLTDRQTGRRRKDWQTDEVGDRQTDK